MPAGFQDVYSFRLGGEYAVSEALSIRAGGLWETASLPPEETSVALVDPAKWQMSTGASVTLADHLRLDGSFSFISYQPLDIRNSTVKQINVYGGDESVVGNGDIRSHGWALGGQASWAFGESKR